MEEELVFLNTKIINDIKETNSEITEINKRIAELSSKLQEIENASINASSDINRIENYIEQIVEQGNFTLTES